MSELAGRDATPTHHAPEPEIAQRSEPATAQAPALDVAIQGAIASSAPAATSHGDVRSDRVHPSQTLPAQASPTAHDDVESTAPRIRRSAAVPDSDPPVDASRIQRAPADAEVIRRTNTFYSGQPKSEPKVTPLQTIKSNLAHDGVAASDVVDHWRKDSNLKIAKTARESLTRPAMETIQRPVESSAWLDTPNQEKGTRKDPAWISAIGNLGTVEDQVLGEPPKKYNGGHLIAWEFLNDAANVEGNIAPQAGTQNQALFRRIERTLMEAVTSGDIGGVELSVYTPYNHDDYQVTYRELFERKVLTDESIRATLEEQGLLDKQLTFAQMAPDTYNTYFLTQTSTAAPVKADSREKKKGIGSQKLDDYSTETSDALIGQAKLGPLTILASNYDTDTKDQVATSFAHIVYLNHRAHPPTPSAPKGTLDTLPDARSDDADERELRALDWMEAHIDVCVEVQLELQAEYGYSDEQSFDAILGALMND